MLIVHLFEAREDFIAQQQGDKIAAAYKNDSGRKPKFENPRQVIGLLSKAGRPYIQWLTNQYIANQFKLEDIERIKQKLIQFNQIKVKLTPKERDLNQYRQISDLYAVMDRHTEGVATESAANKKAYEQKSRKMVKEAKAKIVYKGKTMIMYFTKTIDSSRHFGKDTDWCTAHKEDKHNYFEHYHHYGRLFPMHMKDGKRYQLHIGVDPESQFNVDGTYDEDNYQEDTDEDLEIPYSEFDHGSREELTELRDGKDVSISEKKLIDKYPEARDAIRAAYNFEGTSKQLPDFDKHAKKGTIVSDVMKGDPRLIKDLPSKHMTPDVIKQFTKLDNINHLLDDIPNEFRHIKEYIASVLKEKYPRYGLLKDVASKLPASLRDRIIKSRTSIGSNTSSQAIRPFAVTPSEKSLFYKLYPQQLSDVFKDEQTKEMVDSWVDNIPIDKYRNMNTKFTWNKIRDELKTPEMMNRLVKRMPDMINVIPPDQQTREQTLSAVLDDVNTEIVRDVNLKLLTDDDKLKILKTHSSKDHIVKYFLSQRDVIDENDWARKVAKHAGLIPLSTAAGAVGIARELEQIALSHNPSDILKMSRPSPHALTVAAKNARKDPEVLRFFWKGDSRYQYSDKSVATMDKLHRRIRSLYPRKSDIPA